MKCLDLTLDTPAENLACDEALLDLCETGGEEVLLEYWDGRQELWPSLRAEATSMDRAVAEIVAWLDGERPFSCPGDSALRTLEAIVGFHASHARNATWTELPLTGADREYEILSG